MIGYAVIVEQADDGGYGAWSPELPGCVALGDTIKECLAEMREAIGLYLDVLRERGEERPAQQRIPAPQRLRQRSAGSAGLWAPDLPH